MTKRHVNTFSGGIDRDTSVNKYDNTHYYDAENLRPISNDTFTSGAVSNVDGLLEVADLSTVEFDIPNWGTSDNATISNLTVYKVITIREKLILFADFNLTIPNFRTNSASSGILSMDIVDDEFLFNYTLVRYIGDNEGSFNFNEEMSVVGRYENSNTIKVYWANGTDPLRSVNIVSGESPLTFPTSILDHTPDVTFSPIEDIDIIPGGSYKSGVVQYAYQLYNPQGTISTISPVSNPIILSAGLSNEVGGSDIGENSNKSVRLAINNIDFNFTRIRILALFYEELFSNPQVNIIYEGVNTSSISIVDTNNPIGTMSYEEFLVFNNTLYIPKSIETKNNILFSANVEEATFNSPILDDPNNANYWDSRAYTFPENNNTTSIYDVAFESTISVTPSNWDTVPHDADATPVLLGAMAGANIGSNISSYEKRYKPNSSVLGGEGPNVEFSFSAISTKIDGYGNYEGYDLEVSKQNITGLQPNEVYRIGLVFYNEKGQASFVKWVQDIRVPFVEEITSSPFVAESAANNRTEALNINLVISIKSGREPWLDDPSIKGWQVVRVKRNIEDREQVCNGIMLPVGVNGTESYTRPQSAPNTSDSTKYNLGLPLNTSEYPSGGDSPVLFEIISPELIFNDIELNNSYSTLINRYYEYTSEVVASGTHAFLNAKAKESALWPEQYSSGIIKASKKVSPPIFGVENIYTIGADLDINRYRNETSHPNSAYGTGSDGNNIGIGGTRHVVNINALNIPSAWTSTASLRAINVDIIKDVEATRYGGVTYQARQLNTYIPYGKINDTSSNQDQTDLSDYNGDTYIKMFTYLRNIFQYDYPNNWDLDDGLQEIIAFPVYTSINLDYRSDNINDYIFKGSDVAVDDDAKIKTMAVQETVQFGIQYQPEYYDESIGDLYKYNSVYSKENDAKKYFPKPFDFMDESNIDTKIIASESKTNGEYIDSWSIFKAANFIEVDSSYGSITDIKRFMNQLYCFQENAISLLAVNDRSLINDESGIKLALGTGGVLERYDYISTTTGLANKRSLVESKRALYIIDEYNRELVALQGPRSSDLSRINGFSSKINSLIPSNKILTGYDPKFNEIYLNFDNETWVYSEILGSIIGKFSVNPDLYFNYKGELYSVTGNIINIHNSNQSKLGSKSYITLLINPNSNLVCTYDNLDFRTETDSEARPTVDRILYSNSYISPITKTTKLDDPGKTVSYLARAFRTQVPQTSNSNRMVDTYLLVTFEFDNTSNNKFKLHDVITYYRDAKI